MIWIGFIFLGGILLNSLGAVLSLLNLVIPQSFIQSIGTLIGKLGIFQSILPIDQIMLAFIWVMSAWVAVAFLRFIFGLLGVIPGVSPKLPEQVADFNHKRKRIF